MAELISSTRVFTVHELILADVVDHRTVQSVENVLEAVQKLGIEQIPFREIEVLRLIGHGKTFQVSRCRLKSKVVAVKYMNLSRTGSSDSQHPLRRGLQSIMKQVSIMHHPPLRSHPNIMGLLGYGWQSQESQTVPYVVVEYGSQGCLRQFLASSLQDLRAKMELGGDVACGLMALHSCGIVHGDLRLDNVLTFACPDRRSGSIAKLCDFEHSILLSSGSQCDSRYYGTTLYNAPEVSLQASAPIAREDLHRCDIWAFGLLLWEILLDGSEFFEKEWRSDPTLLLSLNATSSSLTQENSLSDGPPTNRTLFSDDAYDDMPFGRFELANLRLLAKQHVNSIHTRNLEFEKSYLRVLFEWTLQTDPRSRISDLTRSPIIKCHRNMSVSATALRADMAMSAGTFRSSYGMFQRDNPHHITSAHESGVRYNFETLCSDSHRTDSAQSATSQATLCFINGFGHSCDDVEATQYPCEAEDQGHSMAALVRSRLSEVINQSPSDCDKPYRMFLKRGFLLERYFLPSRSLKVAWSPESGVPVSYTPYTDFHSFASTVQLSDDITAAKVVVDDTTPRLTMNVLETAIAFHDELLANRVLHRFDVFQKGCWNETPLQQAARHGDPVMLSLLLTEAARTGHTAQDYGDAGILRWLFCLPDVSSIKTVLQLSSITTARLDAPLPVSFPLHAQWPVKLEGTPLAVAVLVGDERLVAILIDQGANPLSAAFTEHIDGEIWTPLHIAVCYHQAKIFELMWARVEPLTEDARASLQGFPLPCALSYSSTAERLAIHGTSYIAALRKMLSLPLGSLYSSSSFKRTALLQAIDFGDYEVLDALLDHEPNLADIPFRDPNTTESFIYPLHFAARVGSQRDTDAAIKIVRRISEAKPEVPMNQQDDGSTALHMPVTGESSRIIQLLLSQDADTTTLDHQARSVLHRCCTANNVQILPDHGASTEMNTALTGTAIHAMVHTGPVGPVRELTQRGASVNEFCDASASVLHAAVRDESSDVVDLLTEAGADIDVSSEDDLVSAVMIAIELRHFKIAWSLLKDCVDCLTPDRNENTAWQRSLQSGELSHIDRMLSLLLGGSSSQLWAVIIHDTVRELPITVLRALLRANKVASSRTLFDVHIRFHGLTPLHVASRLARIDVMEVLLDHKADVSARDFDGHTPILLACNGVPHVGYGSTRSAAVSLLLHHGAKVLDVNDLRTNCLFFAQMKYDFKLMTVLLSAAAGDNRSESTISSYGHSEDPHDGVLMLCKHALALKHYFALAMQQGEWDFVTICIAENLVDRDVLISCFAQNMQLLRTYARRGNSNMIQRAARGARVSDPVSWIQQGEFAGD